MGRADRRVQRPHGRRWRAVNATARSRDSSAPGCGAAPAPGEPYPFRCPNAGRGDDVDHVLRRELDPAAVAFPHDDDEPNPFVRYRALLHAYHVARADGMSDAEFCALVRELDARVAAVDGHGFARHAVRAQPTSSATRSASRRAAASGSRTRPATSPARTRRATCSASLLQLEVAERLGLRRPGPARPSSRSRAAATPRSPPPSSPRPPARTLRVFVPVDADPAVLARLEELGARVDVCPREPGDAGDPTVRAPARGARRRRAAVHLPGQPERAGGRGRADARLRARRRARAAGAPRPARRPGRRRRARERVLRGLARGGRARRARTALPRARHRADRGRLAAAARLRRASALATAPATSRVRRRGHRSEFMWPWETEPHSVAHGILDDETYDWLAVVEGMLATGGTPVVVDEEHAAPRERARARRRPGSTSTRPAPPASPGCSRSRAAGASATTSASPCSSPASTAPTNQTKGADDEKLPRQGHPVAQGLRARRLRARLRGLRRARADRHATAGTPTCSPARRC